MALLETLHRDLKPYAASVYTAVQSARAPYAVPVPDAAHACTHACTHAHACTRTHARARTHAHAHARASARTHTAGGRADTHKESTRTRRLGPAWRRCPSCGGQSRAAGRCSRSDPPEVRNVSEPM
eukprot:2263302-Rhodomonas_salina.1